MKHSSRTFDLKIILNTFASICVKDGFLSQSVDHTITITLKNEFYLTKNTVTPYQSPRTINSHKKISSEGLLENHI